MTILFFPDNTVLVNFALINRMDLLERLTNGHGTWCGTVAAEWRNSAKIAELAAMTGARGPDRCCPAPPAANIRQYGSPPSDPRLAAPAPAALLPGPTTPAALVEPHQQNDDNDRTNRQHPESRHWISRWDVSPGTTPDPGPRQSPDRRCGGPDWRTASRTPSTGNSCSARARARP
jgi:hypothetical protein